jgi:hypothetical protein
LLQISWLVARFIVKNNNIIMLISDLHVMCRFFFCSFPRR